MRMLLKISIPTESGNDAIRKGTIAKVMQSWVERWRPEAMYFTALDGKRTGIAVVDLPSEADIPSIAEPFFLELGASLEVSPAMNAEDLAEGLSRLP